MSEVLSHVTGRAGVITLNRLETLNALTLPMIRALTQALAAHVADPAVQVVVLRSASPKAFCAGGDMRRIRELSLAGQVAEAHAFFEEEYALIRDIARCPKPYVSLIDGIAMGGGLGLSVHGTHRVVTERALMAMPETAIGFFPDVGGTYFLPRLPHRAGAWLGLTGARLSGAACVTSGLATAFVPSAALPALVQALETGTAPVAEVIAAATAADANAAGDAQRMGQLGAWFDAPDLRTVLARLREVAGSGPATTADGPAAWAAQALSQLEALSPAALEWSLRLMREGASRTLDEALAAELTFSDEAIVHPDFIEGVRAVLVDKDRRPKWVGRLPG